MKTSNKAYMTPAAFRRWMDRFGYTHKGAAERLGLATRTVSQYVGGHCAISKVTAMALWADTHGFPHRAPGRRDSAGTVWPKPTHPAQTSAPKPVAPLPTWRSHRG